MDAGEAEFTLRELVTARGNRLQLPLQDGALDANCTLIAQDCSALNSEVCHRHLPRTQGFVTFRSSNCQSAFMWLVTALHLLAMGSCCGGLSHHCCPAHHRRQDRKVALLAVQIVASLGLTGVTPGDAGDVVFIRAVRDDQRHGGVGLQTEVGRMSFPQARRRGYHAYILGTILGHLAVKRMGWVGPVRVRGADAAVVSRGSHRSWQHGHVMTGIPCAGQGGGGAPDMAGGGLRAGALWRRPRQPPQAGGAPPSPHKALMAALWRLRCRWCFGMMPAASPLAPTEGDHVDHCCQCRHNLRLTSLAQGQTPLC